MTYEQALALLKLAETNYSSLTREQVDKLKEALKVVSNRLGGHS